MDIAASLLDVLHNRERVKILYVAEADNRDWAPHLQDSPEGLQVAPLALNDGAQDMASDNLAMQKTSQKIEH